MIDHVALGYLLDRVDALVWALTDLLVEPMAGEEIFELYRQEAEGGRRKGRARCAGADRRSLMEIRQRTMASGFLIQPRYGRTTLGRVRLYSR